MEKRIGIVGGSGFVGLNLARVAIEQGRQVTIIDFDDRLGRLKASGILDTAAYQFVHLADREASYSLDVDAVVHLAALPHVDYSLHHPEATYLNNVTAAASVFHASRLAEVPVLFTSSIEVYGGNDGALFQENDTLRALSPYAASKIAGESLLESYRACFDVTATTVRLTNLFGPWQAPDRIIPRVILQAVLGKESQIVSGVIRDALYVDDAVRAILEIIDGGHWGYTFNVSTGEGRTLDDIARTITDAVGTGTYVKVPRYATDGRGASLVASPALLKSVVDWRPTVSFQEGIGLTASWYRAHRDWWQPFERVLSESVGDVNFLVDHLRPIRPPR